MNPATFLELPSNSCGLATLICVLGHVNVAVPSAPSSSAYVIIACSTASYSCYCQTICSKLMSYLLIVYGGSGVVSDDSSGDSDVGSGNWLSESADPILDLLPDLYSDSDIFLCKG